MSLENNKAVVRRVFEAFNKRNWPLMDESIADNYVEHTHQLHGRDENRRFMVELTKGFPDFYMALEDMIAEGDKVWAYLTETGTHTREWNLFGITLLPAGKKVTEKAVHMYRLVDGKFVEGRILTDPLDFLQKLGVIEYTEKGKKLLQKASYNPHDAP